MRQQPMVPMAAAVPPVIYRDNWVSASAVARAYPQFFRAPSAAALAEVSHGYAAKLCNGPERFWVAVVARRGPMLLGVVRNHLVFSPRYQFGDYVEFHEDNILGILTCAEAQLCSDIAQRMSIEENFRVVPNLHLHPMPSAF